MAGRILWNVHDRYGNGIYLSQERWEHIIEPMNHPEMAACPDALRETIRRGRRRQDPLNPQKYLYVQPFDNLAEDNTHVVVVVLCRFRENAQGRPEPNNYVVTAYQKEIG